MGDTTIPSEKKVRFVMKALSVSRLCLVGWMIIVLLMTLSVAVPRQISGDLTIGNKPNDGCSCSDTQHMYCDGVEETEPCLTKCDTCIGLDGDGFCSYISKCGCRVDFDCANWDNENCD